MHQSMIKVGPSTKLKHGTTSADQYDEPSLPTRPMMEMLISHLIFFYLLGLLHPHIQQKVNQRFCIYPKHCRVESNSPKKSNIL